MTPYSGRYAFTPSMQAYAGLVHLYERASHRDVSLRCLMPDGKSFEPRRVLSLAHEAIGAKGSLDILLEGSEEGVEEVRSLIEEKLGAPTGHPSTESL